MKKTTRKKLLLLCMVGILVLSGIFVGCSAKAPAEDAAKEPANEETTPEVVEGTDFPTKSITLVVPWSAGGITDRTARVFAPLFEKNLGVSVTVVNKTGASGAVGTEFANGEDSDGYTVLFSAETPGIFRVMGTSKLGFDDFDPLMMVAQDTKLVVVPGDSKYTTFEELVADIKARPGKVKISYSGPGASGHLQGLIFQASGLDLSMTPYGGGNPAMIATISGEVDFTFGNYGTVKDYLETGDLRALAVFSDEAFDVLPDVPPMTEALPEVGKYVPLYFPNCLLVKKGTPEEVEAVLIEAAQKAVQEPEWAEFIKTSSYTDLHEISIEDITNYWNKYTSVTSWLLYDAGAAQNDPADFGIERFEK